VNFNLFVTNRRLESRVFDDTHPIFSEWKNSTRLEYINGVQYRRLAKSYEKYTRARIVHRRRGCLTNTREIRCITLRGSRQQTRHASSAPKKAFGAYVRRHQCIFPLQGKRGIILFLNSTTIISHYSFPSSVYDRRWSLELSHLPIALPLSILTKYLSLVFSDVSKFSYKKVVGNKM